VARSSFFTWATASIEPLNKRALNRISFISDVVPSLGSVQHAPRPLPQDLQMETAPASRPIDGELDQGGGGAWRREAVATPANRKTASN
jgi:hypothetical protein